VLEQLPALCKGVLRSELAFSEGVLSIDFSPAETKLSEVAEKLLLLGYAPSPYSAAERRALEEREQRDFLVRIGVAGFGFMNTMLIAVSLYQGYFSGIDPGVRTFLHWASLIIAFPVILFSAKPFFQSFVSSMVARQLHMDVPIAAGITVTMLYSMWNTFTGADRVYFDSVCALVFLLLLGRYGQQQALLKARQSTASKVALLPLSASVRREGKDLSIPLVEIRSTDTVLISAGSRVPVDGLIAKGASSFNTSVMTGEPLPRSFKEGEEVFAGYLNLESPIELRPLEGDQTSRLTKLLAMLDEGALQKSPLVESAQRMLGSFVAVLLVLAAGTFIYWIPHGFQNALDATVSLLVICCPCALALATPLALATGVRRAAAEGILIRKAEVIERTARVKTVYFDKTGTLTQGTFTVTACSFLEHPGVTKESALRIAAELAEVGSAHPLSRAILEFCNKQAPQPSKATFLEDIAWRTGLGVEGLQPERGNWRLGSVAFALAAPKDHLHSALSTVFLSCEGSPILRFELEDVIAPASAPTLAHLRSKGIQVRMLSGDHSETVAALGCALGFSKSDSLGECSPEDKQRTLENEGTGAMMVGDGVNDATALAAADVGVAVHGDALRCFESADVALIDRDLRAIPDLLEGAKRTVRVVRENLALSLVYNVVGAVAAIAGKVDPLVAALLMPLSSLTVLANSQFSRTFRPAEEKPLARAQKE
jgi:Cu2+-exporting ATPase